MQISSRKQTADYQSKIIKDIEALPNFALGFTPFEDEVIRKYYPSKGTKISGVLNRTRRQVLHRAKKLGVKCSRF